MSDVKEYLSNYKAKLEKEIDLYFIKEIDQADSTSPYIGKMVRMLRDYTQRGGKRLRAALVYYSYKLFDNDPKKDIDLIRVSIFIELIHSYLLILDDIMDRDTLRRGFPTLHTEFKRDHRRNFTKGSSAHFGISMAINTACMAVHKAIAILSTSNFKRENILDAITRLQYQIDLVAQGQSLDILGEVKDTVTEEDVIKVHTLKTAVYTYETPITIGAILAGASQKDIDKLREYAIPAGIAFQLQDDHIGTFGTEEEIGKNVGSDIREGKGTMLTVKTLELCDDKQRKAFKAILGNPKSTLSDIKKARKIITNCGAYEYSRNLARNYVLDSQKALKNLSHLNKEGLDFLEKIAEYMIVRNH